MRRPNRKELLIGSVIVLVGLPIAWAAGLFGGLDWDQERVLAYLEENLDDPSQLEVLKWTPVGDYDAEAYRWDVGRRGGQVNEETLTMLEILPIRVLRLKFRSGSPPHRRVFEWEFAIQWGKVTANDLDDPLQPLVKTNDQELFDYLKSH